MVMKFTITPDSKNDIKSIIRENCNKYLNHRRRYEIFCPYDLFWEKQDFLNNLIQDLVAEFGMRYLMIPTFGVGFEKQIIIIFDTGSSLFDDTYNDFIEDFHSNEENIFHEHCENQRKEIALLLKQKAKLEKKLEECKNDKFDMMAYRDDIIGKISREKNELENANKAQTRYIKEMEENMKAGNEQYKKLKDEYDSLEEKYEDKKRLINSVYGFKQRDLEKANNFYRNKVHELFDMLLSAEFIQKKEKEEKKE